MGSSGIFAVHNDGRVVGLTQQPFATEDGLQQLLANIPDLLPGSQIDQAVPRRWLFVSREVALASETDGGARWAVDHLFLDQEAIPTIVEVKRSSDSRIRREVVGQMLDYAANAVVYWPVEQVRGFLRSRCEAQGMDPDQLLDEFLEEGDSSEEFWSRLKTNLQAGKVRLVFVADEIPAELQRVVEFLNEQMDPAEVLAVEIRQYVGDGLKTLVPRVLGVTARAQQKKPSSGGQQWNEQTFFKALEENKGAELCRATRRILDWCRNRGLRVWWGRGAKMGSFVAVLDWKEKGYQMFAAWSYGAVEIYFQWLLRKPPFDAEGKRRELLGKLNQIPGVNLPEDSITRRPSINGGALVQEDSMKAFLEAMDWVIREIKAV
jgi:hypothetical protein